MSFWTLLGASEALAQSMDAAPALSPKAEEYFLDGEPISSEPSGSRWIDILGLTNRHSLVFASLHYGSASNAGLTGSGMGFEVGYEKSQFRLFKWGPYFSYSMYQLDEDIDFPHTGYWETRENKVSHMSFGVKGRRGVLGYLNLRAGLGISSTSLKIDSIKTNAPTPSTSIGYKESYPLALGGSLGVSVNKSFGKWSYSAELSHEETAFGMQHSLSVTSLNLIVRYLYNR